MKTDPLAALDAALARALDRFAVPDPPPNGHCWAPEKPQVPSRNPADLLGSGHTRHPGHPKGIHTKEADTSAQKISVSVSAEGSRVKSSIFSAYSDQTAQRQQYQDVSGGHQFRPSAQSAQSLKTFLSLAEEGTTPPLNQVAEALADWPPIRDANLPEVFSLAHSNARVRFLALDALIIRWTIANPPAGHNAEVCAACGEPINLASMAVVDHAAWIHYGGEYRVRCWSAWGEMRTRVAVAALIRLALGEYAS